MQSPMPRCTNSSCQALLESMGGGGDDSCFLGFCLDFSLPVGLVTLLAVDGTGSHSSEGMLTVSGPQRTSGPHLERETPIP